MTYSAASRYRCDTPTSQPVSVDFGSGSWDKLRAMSKDISAEGDRPSEDAMFGSSGGQTPQPGGTSDQRPSEADMFGGGDSSGAPAATGTQPPAATAAQDLPAVRRQE